MVVIVIMDRRWRFQTQTNASATRAFTEGLASTALIRSRVRV